MEISKEKQQEIEEQALLIAECFKQVNNAIPNGLKAKADETKLTRSELQAMATSVYITVGGGNNRGRSSGGGVKSSGGPPKDPNRPCTEKQIKKISTEQMKRGANGDAIVGQFLDNVGKNAVGDLTLPEASSLIDLLINQ